MIFTNPRHLLPNQCYVSHPCCHSSIPPHVTGQTTSPVISFFTYSLEYVCISNYIWLIYISQDKISYETIINRLWHNDLAQLKFISYEHKIWWESSGMLLQFGQLENPSSFHFVMATSQHESPSSLWQGKRELKIAVKYFKDQSSEQFPSFLLYPLTKKAVTWVPSNCRKSWRCNLPVSPKRGKLNRIW